MNKEHPDLHTALATCMANRHSCRAFLPDAVPRPLIMKILEAARHTPSWCNAQPWHTWLINGPALERFRKGLTAHAATATPTPDFTWPREYRGVYQARRRESGFQLYEAVGIARGDRAASARQAMENFRLFGAPHLAIVTTDEALGVYGALDCGAYVNDFMLAAHSLGVASIAQAALAAHSAWIRAHLGIGDDRRVVCGISFGYEDTAHPANGFRTSRATVDETTSWVDSVEP